MTTTVSSVVNHFPSAEDGFTTTLSSTISAGATTVGLNSLSGYTTGEVATLIVAPTVSSEKQAFTGVVDTAGLQLTNVVWTTGTNQTHTAGTTVVDYATATHISMISKGILVSHNQDGTHGAITATSVASTGAVSGTTGTFTSDITEKGTTLTTMRDELGYDYVASGGIWTGDSYGSTRNASMTALVCYINGQRGTISAVTARSFTASKDTYIDVLNNSGTFSLVYTEVTNNAASPALAAGSIRIGIIVTGASSIAAAGSVNQGSPSAVLPIASSNAYSVTDSLGNLICNRSPHPTLIGYRQITADFTTTTFGSDVAVTGLSTTVMVPTGARVKITGHAERIGASGGLQTVYFSIYESGTLLARSLQTQHSNNYNSFMSPVRVISPTTGSHTYNLTISQEVGGTITLGAASNSPAFILVELV